MTSKSTDTSSHRRHFVIPDTQCTPGMDDSYFTAIGNAIVDLEPTSLIHLGDHWDFPSLSSYDKGKKSFEGRSYLADVECGNKALEKLMAPIKAEVARRKKGKRKHWDIMNNLHFTWGNHEARQDRVVEENRELTDLVGYHNLNAEELGFKCYPFLQPAVIDGVAYCHYFTSGVMGRPVSSAANMLNKKHQSTIMGHVQDRQIAYAKRADGSRITGIFAGICYEEQQGYLTPQTNTDSTWAGCWVLNEVSQGSFDEMPLSLSYIRRKYG